MLGKSLLCLVLVLATSYGFPTGAITAVCESMMPGHGQPVQTTPFPYTVTTDKTSVKWGELLTITINGGSQHIIKGLFAQVRSGEEPIGKFLHDDKTKTIDCGTGKENALTHSQLLGATELTLQWEAPQNFEGPADILLTIVESYKVYWVKVNIGTVTVMAA